MLLSIDVKNELQLMISAKNRRTAWRVLIRQTRTWRVVIDVKKMRKISSNRKINNSQIWNDDDRCEFDYCYYLAVTKRRCKAENLIKWRDRKRTVVDVVWISIERSRMTKANDDDESFRQHDLKQKWNS